MWKSPKKQDTQSVNKPVYNVEIKHRPAEGAGRAATTQVVATTKNAEEAFTKALEVVPEKRTITAIVVEETDFVHVK